MGRGASSPWRTSDAQLQGLSSPLSGAAFNGARRSCVAPSTAVIGPQSSGSPVSEMRRPH
jgi:hypothetical protein